jgi:hypothetical protein
MSKNQPVIYLAGPIAGCTWNETADWREWAVTQLPEAKCLSPLRGKDFLQALRKVPLGSASKQSSEFAHDALDAAISSQHAIVVRDHWDVESADLLFVNLLPSKDIGVPSIGTMFELAWAWYFKKPAVVAMQKGSPNDHPFVREAAYVVVPSLKQAVSAARLALDLPVDAEEEAKGY